MKVALVLDNPLRDLPGVVLVGYLLAQKGVTVAISQASLKYHEVLPLLPDLVVSNFLRSMPSNEVFYRELLNAGVIHQVLDTEGGVFSSPNAMRETLTKDAKLREAVATYCFWGNTLADHARERGWFQDKQISVTGCPRMDFYHEIWQPAALEFGSKLYWPEEDEADKRPIIMINGNFSFGNPKFETVEAQALAETNFFQKRPELFSRQQADQLAALREMVSLTNRLAAEFPDVRFVYRPHPFEGHEIYHELLEKEKHPNIELNSSGTVDAWLARSRAVIQRGCTTGLEAGMAGLPSLQPDWAPAWEEKPQVDACSHRFTSYESLRDAVRQILEGSYQPPAHIRDNLRDVIESVFCSLDGMSAERVCAAIRKKLSKKRIQTPEYQKKKRQACRDAYYRVANPDFRGKFWKHDVRNAVIRAYTYLVDCKPVRDDYWNRRIREWEKTDRNFTLEQVQIILDAVQRRALDQGLGKRNVTARKTEKKKDYVFGFREGRAILLEPGKKFKNPEKTPRLDES